jgi:hypothetical protein
MSQTTLRYLFTGTFALISLVGAISIQLFTGEAVPAWLVGVIGTASGYLFGHVQANGIKKNGSP